MGSTDRRRRWALGLAAAFAVAVGGLAGADLVARVATYAAWRLDLWRTPRLQERYVISVERFPIHTADSFRTFLDDDRAADAQAPTYAATHSLAAAPDWTTYGAYQPRDFWKPPAVDARSGTGVRVACFGGSTTFAGYPGELQALVDERFGAGAVEILDLGVPSSSATTTLFLMQRFVPRWGPDVIVLYEGFNDLVRLGFARVLAAAGVTPADPRALEIVGRLYAPSRGLLDLLRGRPPRANLAPDDEAARIERPFRGAIALAEHEKATLFLASFAMPDLAAAPPDRRDAAETEVRTLWPMLGSPSAYAADLARYDDVVKRLAATAGVGFVDVAGRLGGRADLFKDLCHFTPPGRQAVAQAVFDAIAPRLAELVAARRGSSSPGGAPR